ncbi:MAG: MFS transporter, partial [Actinomycetota bacterium]
MSDRLELSGTPRVGSGSSDGVTLSRRRQDRAGKRPILWTVSLASMLVSLNSTMIVATLPRLIREFDASFGSTAWLATSCVVAMVSLQPLAGKLGDRLGRRPLFLGGLVWFAVASAAAAGAGSLAMLIVCRVQQAVAGALLMPNGVAILREAAPGERQGARMG